MNIDTLSPFVRAYLECALFSSTDNSTESGGDPLDHNYEVSDFSEKAIQSAIADCEDFTQYQAENLALSGLDDGRAGHNFWLNRNGHGSGFWDEYSQTTCEAYNREQAIAMGTRDFSIRDALKTSCNCPYHACERLSDACKRYGSCDAYVGDDEQIHLQ